MYNKVILIGRLTATPEMVKTASDRSANQLLFFRGNTKQNLYIS